jgi:hypothetical protein
MGANRQSMQRIINDLQRWGSWLSSPIAPSAGAARRSTGKGRRTFDAAMRLQAPRVNKLSGLVGEGRETTHRVMLALRKDSTAVDSERIKEARRAQSSDSNGDQGGLNHRRGFSILVPKRAKLNRLLELP